MDLKNEQLKDTYGNLLTIGTTAGSPPTGTLQNGDGEDITALDVAGTITSDGLTSDGNISLSGNGTGNRWVFLGSETASYAGTFRLQAGGASAGFGGSINMYGHSHASKPGDVAVGISSGSGGSFRVNGNGIDTGIDLFEVKSTRDIAFFDGSGSEAFYWDASAGSLGIGTTSPNGKLNVISNGVGTGIWVGSTNSNFGLEQWYDSATGTVYFDQKYNNNGGSIFFRTKTLGTPVNALTILGSGNVGIGCSPSAKLDVDSGSTQTVSVFKASSTSTVTNNGGALIGIRNTNDTDGNMEGLFFQNSNGNSTSGIIGYNVNHSTNEGLMTFGVRNSSGTFGEKMRIDSSGNVGIGTSTTTYDSAKIGTGHKFLNVQAPSGSYAVGTLAGDTDINGDRIGYLTFVNENNSASYKYSAWIGAEVEGATANQQGGRLIFSTASDGSSGGPIERLLIDSDGKVGIGTLSPDAFTKLTVAGAMTLTGQNTGHGASRIKIGQDTTAISQIRFYGADASTAGILQFIGSSSDGTVGDERMRIDSSGNLLVGKDTSGLANTGAELRSGSSNHAVIATSDSEIPMLVNRKTNDGDLVRFYKDGTSVGSIGTIAGYTYIGSTVGDDAFMSFGANTISPATSTGGGRDNAISLGSGSYRFKDLYLGGSVYLGGTTSANALDDYEEGTFTPVVAGTWTANPTSLVGKYTKIGNVVHVQVTFLGGTKATATSGYLEDLPFAASHGTGAVVDSEVIAQGSALFANTDRIWFTDNAFAVGTNRVTGTYLIN
jgi:hypothetical protein